MGKHKVVVVGKSSRSRIAVLPVPMELLVDRHRWIDLRNSRMSVRTVHLDYQRGSRYGMLASNWARIGYGQRDTDGKSGPRELNLDSHD